MSVCIKLKHKVTKEMSCEYITNLEISTKGTMLYKGEEFDKPSPLVVAINCSTGNGWQYIEVKKSGQWICLDKLRKIWRNNNG